MFTLTKVMALSALIAAPVTQTSAHFSETPLAECAAPASTRAITQHQLAIFEGQEGSFLVKGTVQSSDETEPTAVEWNAQGQVSREGIALSVEGQMQLSAQPDETNPEQNLTGTLRLQVEEGVDVELQTQCKLAE